MTLRNGGVRKEILRIWAYRIVWSRVRLKARLGLAFSNRIDIKSPPFYPDLPVIQSTMLRSLPREDQQFVYSDIDSSSTTELEISFRVLKAMLVSFRIDLPSHENVVKFGFLRQLGLQSGEVDALDIRIAAAARDLLRAFEGGPVRSQQNRS